MDQDQNPKHFPRQVEPQASELVLIDVRLRDKVEELAKERQHDSKDFHQTRRLFTRLRDILFIHRVVSPRAVSTNWGNAFIRRLMGLYGVSIVLRR